MPGRTGRWKRTCRRQTRASGRRPSLAERLARAAARRPRRTIALWFLLVAASAGLYLAYRDSFQAQDSFLSWPDSKRAAGLIEQHIPSASHDTEVVVVRSPSHTVDEQAFRAEVAGLRRMLFGVRGGDVIAVTTFVLRPGSGQAVPGLKGPPRHPHGGHARG